MIKAIAIIPSRPNPPHGEREARALRYPVLGEGEEGVSLQQEGN